MIIAECGINHNGDIDLARQLIANAKDAGADVVKFQKRTLEVVIPASEWNISKETPWGSMPYIEYKHRLEFCKREYDEIDRYCKQLGIPWTASVWDSESLDFLIQYDIPFIKVPSAMITEYDLLYKIVRAGKPIVMSIGMSTQKEAQEAIAIVSSYCDDLTILHCNSSYPANYNELDLNVIQWLKKRYKSCKIGYSGHELGYQPTIIAALLGAEVIERHITLDKNMWGSDQKASLDIAEFKDMCKIIKMLPIWLGDNKIKCYLSEEIAKAKLRR